jgi:hypothetical protein
MLLEIETMERRLTANLKKAQKALQILNKNI